jgi:hypothetical protein
MSIALPGIGNKTVAETNIRIPKPNIAEANGQLGEDTNFIVTTEWLVDKINVCVSSLANPRFLAVKMLSLTSLRREHLIPLCCCQVSTR